VVLIVTSLLNIALRRMTASGMRVAVAGAAS